MDQKRDAFRNKDTAPAFRGVSAEMATMISRGRGALLAYLTIRYYPGPIPIGTSNMAIVTLGDFAARPLLVLDHAMHHQPVSILYDDGSIVALLCSQSMSGLGG